MATELIIRGVDRIAGAVLPVLDGEAPHGPSDKVEAAPVTGNPVVLVGGLATTARVLTPMTQWLTGLGYDATPMAIGAGLDCAQRSVDVLTDRIRDCAEQAGRPVRLLGHSRGGQFARAAGAQSPDHVAGLVTLGSPFDLFSLALPTLAVAATVTVAGTVGLPHMARMSCLFGGCCRRFRELLRAPWPDGTPFTSIYSRSDRVVPVRASIDGSAHNVEVTGSHLELLTGRSARHAIADALARCDGDTNPAAA
ncbi:esterase/lipase family protein [Pseudonocardia parietis]|uniref:Pimeloyl-ACP methyl ester carboxylesterase n=1 Tax=Pseudonocardia parietis TaxID=570936 RepID=A0ABS4VUX9_9PSEU|nr:alpha/beta hydrolase [Pseudonocardia parietis]MBP2367616.1 pimeloyl-ACP methyl ester carboxylesterase [Pseudonocardia parietis]